MIGFIIELIYSILNSSKIKLVIIKKNAVVPYKECTGAAGYSVYCPDEIIIPKGQRVLIPLGVSIEIPYYHYVRVAPVNYLSMKGIDIGAGVINSSYSGEIKIILINNSDSDYLIDSGDKIAQLIITRCYQSKLDISCDYQDVTDSDDLFDTESEFESESEDSVESDQLAENVESFDNNDDSCKDSVGSFDNNEYTHVM